jgi:hypothetical protein
VGAVLLRNDNEVARIRLLYGNRIVSVVTDTGEAMRRVHVESIGHLLQMARRDGRSVLHRDNGKDHVYYLLDGEVGYEYVNEWPAKTLGS